jgi:hypothetical protein
MDGLMILQVATLKFAIKHNVPCRMYSNSTRSKRPGRTGFVAWSRSNACMPLFSSVLMTCVPAAANSVAFR